MGFHSSYGAPEIVVAGLSAYEASAVREGVVDMHRRVRDGEFPEAGAGWKVARLDEIAFGPVHPTWAGLLMLGAVNLYGDADFPAVQVLPPARLRTKDVPDLARQVDLSREAPWRWQDEDEEWRYPLDRRSHVYCDLPVLLDRAVLYVEHDERDAAEVWAAFSRGGPAPIPDDAVRQVPWGTLLACDETVEEVLSLELGEYATRAAAGARWEIARDD
jgi:hypothetical protein